MAQQGLSPAMGWGSLIAQGIGNTISAFGSFGITRSQNAIAQSQANIARINAQKMRMQYESTLRASEKDVQRTTMAAGRVKSSQRAALAANGIAIGEGSAAELVASTDIVKEIDVNQIKANATQQAWGYRMQAAGYEGQAIMAEASKQNKWDVFGTTLLGASQYSAANYMQAGLTAYSAMQWQQNAQAPAGSSWRNLPGASQYGYATNRFTGWGDFSGAAAYGR